MKPKDKLIQAATELFSKVGYGGASVNDIAERANMNVSLINYYFRDKEGLLRAVMGELAHEKLMAAERLISKCETETEFRVRLDLFLKGLATLFAEQSHLIKLFFYELERGFDGAENQYKVAFSGLFDSFIKFLKSAHEKKFIRETPDIRVTAAHLLGPLTSLAKSKNAAAKYLGVTLEDQEFRDALVKDLVSGIVRSS